MRGAASGGNTAAEPQYSVTKQTYSIIVGLGGNGGGIGLAASSCLYRNGETGQQSKITPLNISCGNSEISAIGG